MDFKLVFGQVKETNRRYSNNEYKKLIEIVFSDADLRSKIRAELADGWKLHGSPFLMREYSGYICQAVVKEVAAGGTRKVTRYGKKTSRRSGRR